MYSPEEIVDRTSLDAVKEIRRAAIHQGTREIVWYSKDRTHHFEAFSPSDPDVDVAELANWPIWRTEDVLNGWIIDTLSLSKSSLKSTLQATEYAISPLVIKVAEWEAPSSLIDPRVNDPIASIEESANYSAAIQNRIEPTTHDLANIDNAIYDLAAQTDVLEEEIRQKRLAMSPDEKFHERQMRRKWDSEPPENKTGHDVWWNISTTSQLYSIYATTAEEAIQTLEDTHNEGRELLMFQIKIENDETQEKFVDLQEKKVLYLIPFSNVPYPEDRNNMTEEQRAAFDKIRDAFSR